MNTHNNSIYNDECFREMDKLVGGLHYLSNIIGGNSCSTQLLPNLLKSIGTIRGTMLHPTSNLIEKKTNRQKRSMDLVSAMSGGGDSSGVSESIVS